MKSKDLTMLMPDSLDHLDQLISQAKRHGATAAEAVFSRSRSLSISVRKGEVETIDSDENADLGLRVFVGQKHSVVSVSEFSPKTLERLVERCVAMAKMAPEDEFAGLSDPRLHYKSQTSPDLEIYDTTDLTATELMDRAKTCEAAGLAINPCLSSDTASAGLARYDGLMLTSDGFSGSHKTSLFYQSARLIATDKDGQMERDGEGRSTRFLSDLPIPQSTGELAAKRTLMAMSPRKIQSQKAPVIFDPRVSKSLIGLFLGAISGTSVARGSSYLKGKLGQTVFSKGVFILDDPYRLRGLGSDYYDDEGVATQKRYLVEDGQLKTWLLNSAAAKQLGMTSTGHASRSLAHPAGVSSHNVTLETGTQSQSELMREAGFGVIITSMFGPSVNSDTGDWSAGASGFWFDGQDIAYPVNEMTVAGNLIDIFARLIPASDLEIKGTVDAPSILVDGLSLGGK
jgi:PmbA protein